MHVYTKHQAKWTHGQCVQKNDICYVVSFHDVESIA